MASFDWSVSGTRDRLANDVADGGSALETSARRDGDGELWVILFECWFVVKQMGGWVVG